MNAYFEAKKQKEGDNMPLKTDDLFMQVNDTKSVTLAAECCIH